MLLSQPCESGRTQSRLKPSEMALPHIPLLPVSVIKYDFLPEPAQATMIIHHQPWTSLRSEKACIGACRLIREDLADAEPQYFPHLVQSYLTERPLIQLERMISFTTATLTPAGFTSRFSPSSISLKTTTFDAPRTNSPFSSLSKTRTFVSASGLKAPKTNSPFSKDYVAPQPTAETSFAGARSFAVELPKGASGKVLGKLPAGLPIAVEVGQESQ